MRHWSRLATRNWSIKPLRALGAALAIALGTGVVVWVTCCYESVRVAVREWANDYIGAADVTVTSPAGKYDVLPQRMVAAIEQVEGIRVVTPLLITRVRAKAVPRARATEAMPLPSNWEDDGDEREFDLHGIDLAKEFAIRNHDLVAGRMLAESDEFACLLERSYADEKGVGLGDFLMVSPSDTDAPAPLEIVGMFERRTIGRVQKAMAISRLSVAQALTHRDGMVNQIDVTLAGGGKDAEPEGGLWTGMAQIWSAPTTQSAAKSRVLQTGMKIRGAVQKINRNALVRTAAARMDQINMAQRQQQFIVVLLSCIAMLTAMFIILGTLSMGMVERIHQFGLMRCIGLTRRQLAWLVFIEVVPLGMVGIIAGVPVGLLMTRVTVALVPDYIGSFIVNWPGVVLASLAGLLTSMVAALLPAVSAMRVSPLEAARPRARAGSSIAVAIALALGLLLIVGQHFQLLDRVQRTSMWFVQFAAAAVVLLYVGYALAAPSLIGVIGRPAVALAAAALRLRARLLREQVGHAVWRSAGICCGLMVGLSLIVAILVVNESVISGWKFPKQFPEGFCWSLDQMTPQTHKIVGTIPGILNYTTANAANVLVEERPLFFEQIVRSVTWFMGCEPDSFFDLVRVEFVEGDKATAVRQLKQGGFIVVADDFARSRNKHLGDKVRIYYGNMPPKDFQIAGVIQSPALDVAAGYFQALNEYNVVASGSVLGTNSDMEKWFQVTGARVVLLNFDLPPEPMPANWPPARGTPEARLIPSESFNEKLPLERRWERYRKDKVLREIRLKLDSPSAAIGTISDLKDEIDMQLRRVTNLLTAIPGMALLVAALGVANLMTANVTSRSKQIAVLRAVGATRAQMVRLVVGEALVLGLIGCGLGVGLGMHLAWNIREWIRGLWGLSVSLELPWGYLAVATGLTVGLCILAGVLPARHAARTNIVEAMRVS